MQPYCATVAAYASCITQFTYSNIYLKSMKYARSAPPGPHGGAAGDDEVARVRDAGQSARHRRGLLARKV